MSDASTSGPAVNAPRLFLGSCVALVATSVAFATVGAVMLARVIDGRLKKRQQVRFMMTGKEQELQQIDVIEKWVDEGTAAGDPDGEGAPLATEDPVLSRVDLTLEMAEPLEILNMDEDAGHRAWLMPRSG